MKAFALLLTVTLFAFGNCEGEDSSSSSEELRLDQLSTILKSKFNITAVDDFIRLANLTETQCPDIENILNTAAEQVAACIDQLDLKNSDDTLCSLVRKNLASCAEPVRKAIANCLPQESKDLPGMAVKIVRAIIDQACNSTVEEILELFNPCRFEKDFTTYEACTKIKDVFLESRNKLPTKSLVCKTLPKVKQCAKAHEDASCSNPVTKQAVIHFYDAVENAIQSDCQDINKTK